MSYAFLCVPIDARSYDFASSYDTLALQMKELQLIDLTKQLADINARLKQFAALYDVVKNERNSYANAIQAASQNIAEMRERIKILHNEVDILKNESASKDKALVKERSSHSAAAAQRDSASMIASPN